MRKVRGYCDFCTHSAEEGDKWESQCQMAAFALTTPKGSAICKSCVVNIVNKLRGSQGFEEWMTTANKRSTHELRKNNWIELGAQHAQRRSIFALDGKRSAVPGDSVRVSDGIQRDR